MSNLQELKSNFETLKQIRLNIKKIFDNLGTLKQRLKSIYLDYIEQNKKKNFIFGLDSLHFQNTLIDLEYENMDKIYKIIDNKMYCEYYKLFKLICKYAEETVNEKKILEICKLKTTFPIYKDLEQFKVYEFGLINDLHHNIIQLLDEMFIFYKNKETELETDEIKSRNGLNLDNYVNTLSYNNAILYQNIKLYIRYLQVYHKYHTSYLSRLDIKLKLMWGQMNEDIRINSMSSGNEKLQTQKIKPLTNNTLKRVPSISFEQNQMLNNIMKDDNNPEVKKELETILSYISDSLDTEVEKDEELLQDNDEVRQQPQEEQTQEQIKEEEQEQEQEKEEENEEQTLEYDDDAFQEQNNVDENDNIELSREEKLKQRKREKKKKYNMKKKQSVIIPTE